MGHASTSCCVSHQPCGRARSESIRPQQRERASPRGYGAYQDLRRHRRARHRRFGGLHGRGACAPWRERRRKKHADQGADRCGARRCRRDPPAWYARYDMQPARGLGPGYRCRFPGAVAHPRPDRRPEHLVPPGGPNACAHHIGAEAATSHTGVVRGAGPAAGRSQPRSAQPLGGRKAVDRDREGDFPPYTHLDPRRGHLRPVAARGGMAARPVQAPGRDGHHCDLHLTSPR